VKPRLLIVEDEDNLRELLRIVFEGEGYTVREAATYAGATRLLAATSYNLVICDIVLPDGNGLDLVRTHHASRPDIPFLVITAHSSPTQALTALRDGAVEYLSKPFDVDELKLVVAKTMARPREVPAIAGAFHIGGRSPSMWPLLGGIPQVAHSDATVLLTGESGTGKELLARAIHAASPRAAKPFVPINCGALPEGLLESELFGHVRGSFTGAVRDKRGLMQEAEGGTLFLEEVDVDVRVIAATNSDLKKMIEQGKFREDLYFRIDVIHLVMPPLRERVEDIAELAQHFAHETCRRLGFPPKQIRGDAMAVLENYQWPGNVRELENVIERTVATESSELITVSSLPPSILEAEVGALPLPAALPMDGLDIEAHLDNIRRELMRQALKRAGGVQKEAARLLRMTYRAFRYHAEKDNLGGEE
jgi:two-component system, NtrC family, response regulator PilR